MKTGKNIIKQLEFGMENGECFFVKRCYILPIHFDPFNTIPKHITKPKHWKIRRMMWGHPALYLIHTIANWRLS